MQNITNIVLHWGDFDKISPSSTNSNLFYNTEKSKITLHVPDGAKALYEANPFWSDGFKAIVEQ